MRFTQELGYVASTGDTFKPEKVQMMYLTGAAITVGKGVILGSVAAGSTVITATTADDHALCGIFEGETTGRGAATTVTGFTGNDAISGEAIWVTVVGAVTLLAYEVTTASTIDYRKTLGCAVRAGIFTVEANPAAGLISPVIAMGTNTATATGGSATNAYVRLL